MRLLLLLVAATLLVVAARAWRGGAPSHRPPPPGPEPDVDPGDPWSVLGVGRGASREEIRRAYREQMKRYHPDRVADLGEELRAVAHAKALAIQRAYRELGGE